MSISLTEAAFGFFPGEAAWLCGQECRPMEGSKNLLLQLKQGLYWYFPLWVLDQAFDISVTNWGQKKKVKTPEHYL